MDIANNGKKIHSLAKIHVVFIYTKLFILAKELMDNMPFYHKDILIFLLA